MPTCLICGKTFEPQVSGDIPASITPTKCPECAAKGLIFAPAPRSSSREEAVAFKAELDAIAPTQPLFTWILIAICAAVFAVEILKGAGFDNMSPDLAIRLGANYGPLTLSGQWWRLLTSMFLHFGFLHIAMNMLCLWSLGTLAERLMGRAAFLLLYFATGIAGGLLSLAVHPQLVSAGASGSVFGVAGGLITYLALKKAPLSFERAKKQLSNLGIFLGINFVYSLKPGVDMMAHAGGVGSGLLIAAVLPRFLTAPGAETVPAPFGEKSPINKRIGEIGAACAIVFLLSAFAIHHLQADSMYVLGSLAKIDAGQSAAVLPALEKIAARQPNSYLAHFALGAAYLRTNQAAGAIRELTAANNLQSGNAAAVQELAAAYLSQNDFPNAITNFRASLAIQSDNPSAHLGLASSLLLAGQYADAVTEGRTTVAAMPNSPDAHSVLGQAEFQLGSTDDGLKEMAAALQLDPANPDLRSRLLDAYKISGHTAEYNKLNAQPAGTTGH